MNSQKIKTKIQSMSSKKWLRFSILIVASLIILTTVFIAGTKVGERRASFAFNSANNYYRNFDNMPLDFIKNTAPNNIMGNIANVMMGGRNTPKMMGGNFINSHGSIGQVIKITNSSLFIVNRDGTEETIETSTSTIIRNKRNNSSVNEIKIDDTIAVIGTPNVNGSIQAKLIRIFPNWQVQNKTATSTKK
jgi:hypothetical protein